MITNKHFSVIVLSVAFRKEYDVSGAGSVLFLRSGGSKAGKEFGRQRELQSQHRTNLSSD
jgi:hypothetical protein